MGKLIEHKNNSEFIGDRDKFKYLAIHGYERWQVDKDGKLRDGMSSEWIKDYCRKDSDPDYMKLTMVQRYVLDGMRRLTGLHGKWCPNDAMWVARALCAAPVERKYVTYAVTVLVLCGLVTLSNEQLGSLEGREEKRSSSNHSTGRAGRAAEADDSHHDLEAKAKAAPKAATSVPKIQGKISVKPNPLSAEEQDALEGLSGQWRFYKLPESEADIPVWTELIRKNGGPVYEDLAIPNVMAWMMFINNDGYWKGRIHSVKDFARCYPTMYEQYLKCGGDDLREALLVAGRKYAESLETFEVVPLADEWDPGACHVDCLHAPGKEPLHHRYCTNVPEGGSVMGEDEDGESFKVEDVEISDSAGL